MKNPILASFDQQPILISEGMESQFEAYLDQAFLTQGEIEQMSLTTPPQMSDDFWPEPGTWFAKYRPYDVVAGILLIPIRGVTLSGFTYALSWATGYEYIGKAMDRGLADPNVKGIALVIDSGGGDVRGNFDLVDRIYDARDVKPIRAFANEHAYSAAYSIASAAETVTVARTGGVGSIGILTMHVDLSKAIEADGVKITFIHYGKHKVDGNPYEPLSASAKARIQDRVNDLGEVFVSTVARNRGMSEKAVRDTEALTFTAAQSTSNGLADYIGSLDDALTAFAADMSKEDDTMTKVNTAANTEAATFDATAVDAARAEGFDAGKAEGASAEKERIKAILTSDEGKARPISAMATAMNTSMSVEEAGTFLAALPQETAVEVASEGKDAFTEAMDKAEHPNLGAPNESGEDQKMSRAERALLNSGRGKRNVA